MIQRACWRFLALGLGLSVIAPVASAISGDFAIEVPALRLKSGVVQTNTDDGWATIARQIAGISDPVVMQLDGPITPARREALTNAGVLIGEYIPDFAFISDASQANADSLAALDFVRWAGEFQTSWKLDPEIGTINYSTPERIELANAGQSKLVVTLFPGADVSDFTGQLELIGATYTNGAEVGRHWLFDVQMPTDDVADLAALAHVQFIEDAPEGEYRNATTAWILQSDEQDKTPIWDQGLHGEGQIAGLIDGTLKTDHCMFNDPDHAIGPDHRKIIALRNPTTVDSHGTHTAGTFVGDQGDWGVPDGEDGMVPAAKLSFSNVRKIFEDNSTFYPRLIDAHNDGARVHSNSWGDDNKTVYTTWCQQADQFMWEQEDNLVVFAISNKSTIRTPENAKNILAVAGTKDAPNEETACSGGSGPTKDGRRRPEIMAPSCSIASADSFSNCGTTLKSGTSMAAPAISGMAVLTRQYFTDGFYPVGRAGEGTAFVPSGALLKGVILNAGQDISGIDGYPTNREGWGRLNLDKALYFDGDDRRLVVFDVRNADGMETGDAREMTFSVVDTSSPLRITMIFTEPPATANSETPVINNLDLSLNTPSGDEYIGNVFSSGRSAPGGTADTLNSTEQIYLDGAELGRHTIRVEASAINDGPQGFALVISGGVRYQPTAPLGDMNCDGAVNFNDIDAFVDALTDFATYSINYPQCDPFLGDVNGDNSVNFLDIDGFIDLLD